MIPYVVLNVKGQFVFIGLLQGCGRMGVLRLKVVIGMQSAAVRTAAMRPVVFVGLASLGPRCLFLALDLSLSLCLMPPAATSSAYR